MASPYQTGSQRKSVCALFGPECLELAMSVQWGKAFHESKADFAGTGHQYAMAHRKIDRISNLLREAHAEAAA